jgi:hypothetical protein
MLKRMTIWAQNLKIAGVVVFAISIFVMHAKNFWMFVISASLARFNQIAPLHSFSHSGKCWFPQFFCGFINAFFGTIFAFVRRRIQKLRFAMSASVLNGAFFRHRLVVASWRAIFGFIGSAGNVRKIFKTNCAC